MKTRTTLILALIAAVLVIVAILSGRTEKSRERIAPGPIFPELQREAVAEQVIRRELEIAEPQDSHADNSQDYREDQPPAGPLAEKEVRGRGGDHRVDG